MALHAPEQRPAELKHPPRVVVAEDQPEMRELIATMLRREGYAVTEAIDGDKPFDLATLRTAARNLAPLP